MIDLKEKQREVYNNKVNKGFNVTDISKEFCFLYGEVSEAYEAYRKKKDDLHEELADIVIYTMGLAEILNVDLEESILNKIAKNNNRKYDYNDKGILEKVGE